MPPRRTARVPRIARDQSVLLLEGRITEGELLRKVAAAIGKARELHLKKLSVSFTGLAAFEPPSPAKWSFFVREWARAARGAVTLELVLGQGVTHLGELGTTVAANAGLKMAVREPARTADRSARSVKRRAKAPPAPRDRRA